MRVAPWSACLPPCCRPSSRRVRDLLRGAGACTAPRALTRAQYLLLTYRCKYVQFLLFWACALSPQLAEVFIGYCVRIALTPDLNAVARRATAAYAASFIARAQFVPIATVMHTLRVLQFWAMEYVDLHSASIPAHPVQSTVAAHGPFYAVCQAILYIVCFRHAQLLADADGIEFLRGLELDRLVHSRFNPLRAVLPAVVREFAHLSGAYELVYCYNIIHSNRRLPPLVFDEAADAFFPFDPCTLPICGGLIAPYYQEWVAPDLPTELTGSIEDGMDGAAEAGRDGQRPAGSRGQRRHGAASDSAPTGDPSRRHRQQHPRSRCISGDSGDSLDISADDDVLSASSASVVGSVPRDGHGGVPEPFSESNLMLSAIEAAVQRIREMAPDAGRPPDARPTVLNGRDVNADGARGNNGHGVAGRGGPRRRP